MESLLVAKEHVSKLKWSSKFMLFILANACIMGYKFQSWYAPPNLITESQQAMSTN